MVPHEVALVGLFVNAWISRPLRLVRVEKVGLVAIGVLLDVSEVIKGAFDQLNCDHLLVIGRIGNALVILTALKGELLLVAVLLLLHQVFNVLLPAHLLCIVEVWQRDLLKLAFAGL